MRTKTVLLSALLGTLGSLSVQAQNVYSLNSVGYITVSLPAGFSIIADQLLAAPQAGFNSNALGVVLPADFVNGNSDFDQVYKYTSGVGYKIYTISSSYPNGYVFSGSQKDPGTNVTLLPGEAVLYQNVQGSPESVTFVGTVPQGSNNVNINLGFNLISSPAPEAGALTSTLSFPVDFVNGNTDFDQAYLFTNGLGYTIYTVSSSSPTGWNRSGSDGREPSVAVGQGFLYDALSEATNWGQAFNVNQ